MHVLFVTGKLPTHWISAFYDFLIIQCLIAIEKLQISKQKGKLPGCQGQWCEFSGKFLSTIPQPWIWVVGKSSVFFWWCRFLQSRCFSCWFQQTTVKRKDLPNLLNHSTNFTNWPCLDDDSRKHLQEFHEQWTLYILINQDSRGCINYVSFHILAWNCKTTLIWLFQRETGREGRKEGRAEGRLSSTFFTKCYVIINIYLDSFQKQTELLSNGWVDKSN